MIHDGSALYTDLVPSPKLLEAFVQRRDQQIMGLELMAISLGLSTVGEQLSNRNAVIHCDNIGAESAIRRGTAASFDHAQFVHEHWTDAAERHTSLWVERVGAHDNIADLPSCGEFRVLEQAGAQYAATILRKQCWDKETWDILSHRWRM